MSNPYAKIVEISESVSWKVADVLADHHFNPQLAYVPDEWLGIEGCEFLDAKSRLRLNQQRAFSYIHMLGNYEDFIACHISAVTRHLNTDNAAQVRAIFRFGDEEMKHQELFEAACELMELDGNCEYGRYFDAGKRRLHALTSAIMEYPDFSRAMILQAFEWGTQRHYVETAKSLEYLSSDPLYAELLRLHWLEESQHVRIGELEIRAMAKRLTEDQKMAAFADMQAIAELIGATFAGQVEAEISFLKRDSALTLSDEQEQRLQQALMQSMSAIWAEVAMTHPKFQQLAMEISPQAAAQMAAAS